MLQEEGYSASVNSLRIHTINFAESSEWSGPLYQETSQATATDSGVLRFGLLAMASAKSAKQLSAIDITVPGTKAQFKQKQFCSCCRIIGTAACYPPHAGVPIDRLSVQLIELSRNQNRSPKRRKKWPLSNAPSVAHSARTVPSFAPKPKLEALPRRL